MGIDFDKFIIFDGAMGTMLIEEGLNPGELPESYNITHPDVVRKIHKKYVDAGANIITTNTFGANELKYKNSEYSYHEIIKTGIDLAKSSGEGIMVAQDIGPIGQLLKPLGTLSFEDAYNIFKNQMILGEKYGADLILIETMSDIYEAKAAVLAAKENTKLPVICTLSFQSDGRTLTGTDALTAVSILEGLGLSALGINCSLGPKDMLPIVEEILRYSHIPVIVQPNRGMPKYDNGKSVYDLDAKEFGEYVGKMADVGTRIFGGCCGTTPEFIRGIKDALKDKHPVSVKPIDITTICSSTQTVSFGDELIIIGERINPTGRKDIKEALINHNIDYLVTEAINQKNSGAHVLDINVGLPQINEEEILKKTIQKIQEIITLPLVIDSSDTAAIEEAVRLYNGKPLINSVNGTLESMQRIFPIVKKYGCAVIGLALDEDGIPDSAEKRLEIAENIIKTAESFGIPKRNIIIDCLVVTASAQQSQVIETLKAIQLIKNKLNVKTILGISNVSHGLPQRELLNSAYLLMAVSKGLDSAIINPLSKDIMSAVSAYKVLYNIDKSSKDYISRLYQSVEDEDLEKDLKQLIIEGLIEQSCQKAKELLNEIEPIRIVEEILVPALNTVGQKYEAKEFFLPQLMQSAQAVKAVFEILKDGLKESDKGDISKGKILLATVKGDVHDIGKNIVKILLENYGFDVLDLGKDVSKEEILEQIKRHDITLVGLSSLMTTTVKNMEETITFIRANAGEVKVMVGGAVLNKEYAEIIGADFFGTDGIESVKIAQEVFNSK